MAKTTTILVSASLGQRNKHWGVNNNCQSKINYLLRRKNRNVNKKMVCLQHKTTVQYIILTSNISQNVP